jgi:hypothetical protein
MAAKAETRIVLQPDRESLAAKVTFPNQNELSYYYTRIRTQNGETVKTITSQRFSFNAATAQYDKVGEPDQTLHRMPAPRKRHRSR